MQLQIQDIHKSYGDHHVLRGLSLNVSSGQALGLLGRNGAGKTTLIRIIMNVFPADNGQILLDGKPFLRSAKTIGYLPEEKGLYADISLIRQLVYLGMLRGLTRDEAVQASDYWLDRLSMTGYREQNLETLSKGNQQKIQLIASLLTNPEIVILDEPFSGLDPVNVMMMREIVSEIVKEGRIVMLSGHQMPFIEQVCQNIAILDEGVIDLAGDLAKIKQTYPRNTIEIRMEEEGHRLPPEQTSEILRDLMSAKSIRFEEVAVQNGGRVLVTLEEANDRGHLLDALAGNGLSVERFLVVEPTLEDIFLKKTGYTREDLAADERESQKNLAEASTPKKRRGGLFGNRKRGAR